MSIPVQSPPIEQEETLQLYNGSNGKASPRFLPNESMPQSQDGLRVSEEEYWQFYYQHLDFNYEWNDGILEEKPMAKVIGSDQYQWFYLVLNSYGESHPNIHMVNLEIGFRLPLAEKTTIRKPDLFIVLDENPVPLHPDDATFRGICDICVESLSDSDQIQIDRDVINKRNEYAEAGVREYYILDPDGRYTTFYRLVVEPKTGKRSYDLLPISPGGIVRSEVMPGFQFRVRDLYRMPPLESLVEDEVYRGYVWLSYQAQKQRAEEAEVRAEEAMSRAEQERQRAEQERLRAEQERLRAKQSDELAQKYAAKLRALGMLDETESIT